MKKLFLLFCLILSACGQQTSDLNCSEGEEQCEINLDERIFDDTSTTESDISCNNLFESISFENPEKKFLSDYEIAEEVFHIYMNKLKNEKDCSEYGFTDYEILGVKLLNSEKNSIKAEIKFNITIDKIKNIAWVLNYEKNISENILHDRKIEIEIEKNPIEYKLIKVNLNI